MPQQQQAASAAVGRGGERQRIGATVSVGNMDAKKGARNEHAAETDEHVCARGTEYLLEPRALNAAGTANKNEI